MQKYENYVKIWKEFDIGCDELDHIFDKVRGRRISCDLSVR